MSGLPNDVARCAGLFIDPESIAPNLTITERCPRRESCLRFQTFRSDLIAGPERHRATPVGYGLCADGVDAFIQIVDGPEST